MLNIFGRYHTAKKVSGLTLKLTKRNLGAEGEGELTKRTAGPHTQTKNIVEHFYSASRKPKVKKPEKKILQRMFSLVRNYDMIMKL